MDKHDIKKQIPNSRKTAFLCDESYFWHFAGSGALFLPPGTSDAGYLHAFDRVVKPIADPFRPQLVLVSAGQNPNFFDPLAHMMVSSDGFRRFAEIAVEIMPCTSETHFPVLMTKPPVSKKGVLRACAISPSRPPRIFPGWRGLG